MLLQKLRASDMDTAYGRVLKLLKNKIVKINGKTGFYHFIEEKKIGNVATAQGLLIYSYLNERPDSLNELLNTIESDAYNVEDDLDNGCFSFVTPIHGVPCIEAIAWVLLGLLAGGLSHDSDIVIRNKEWIQINQNDDGGWGTRKNLHSRIYSTFLASRCLSLLEPDFINKKKSCIRNAEIWINSCQNPDDGGWGASLGENSTPIHTAFALLALNYFGCDKNETVEKGIQYIYSQWDQKTMWEHTTKFEEYSIKKGEFDQRFPFHYSTTAWIIIALLTFSENIFHVQIFSGIDWIIKSQNKDGSWSFRDLHPNRFWAIHDAILAITTFIDKAITVKNVDDMVLMDEIIILTKGHNSSNHKTIMGLIKPLLFLILFGIVFGIVLGIIIFSATGLYLSIGHLVQQYWAWLFIVVYFVAIYPLMKLKILNTKETIFSIIIPAILIIIQYCL